MTDVSFPRGMVPPVPTFLDPDGGGEPQAQYAFLTTLLDSGVDGIVALGTAGEGAVLSPKARQATLEATRAACAGRTDFLVGCSGHTVAQVLRQVDEAAAYGAAGALLLPPFYFCLNQPALALHMRAIADRAAIPVALYHIPALTRSGFDVATVTDLATHPNVVGLKDSDRDFVYHEALRQALHDDFAVFQGAAPMLLASLALGNTDTICPVTALVPEWEAGLRRAIVHGDLEGARRLAGHIATMARLFNRPGAPMPANYKAVANLLGCGPATPYEPTLSLDDYARRALRDGLQQLGLEVVR